VGVPVSEAKVLHEWFDGSWTFRLTDANHVVATHSDHTISLRAGTQSVCLELARLAAIVKRLEQAEDIAEHQAGIVLEVEDEVERLKVRVKELENLPSVEHCKKERSAGAGGCGACALCCGELRSRAEDAEAENKRLQRAARLLVEEYLANADSDEENQFVITISAERRGEHWTLWKSLEAALKEQR
jgi:hypothetical protein